MSIDKKYKLYVFDLDGTVADTKKDLGRALQEALFEAGCGSLSERQVVSAIGQGAKNAVQKLTGTTGEALDMYVASFMEKYDVMCCDNVMLYEGAKELLYRLKSEGAYLALVTMKFRSAVHKILKKLDIDIFDSVLTFDDVQKRKPDPESLFMLMNRFEVSAPQTLMVGDSITDVKYAKAAGVDICIMEHGYGQPNDILAEKPAYVLKSFSEF